MHFVKMYEVEVYVLKRAQLLIKMINYISTYFVTGLHVL